jgi:hypothetical protein
MVGIRVWGWAGIALIAVASLWGLAQNTPQEPLRPPKPLLLPETNRLPDVNDQWKLREQTNRKQNFDAANAARQRQMAKDSDMLLTMAMALKAEVDNTKASKLSESAIRKADIIERLAHGVKEKMTLTIGPN